MKWYAIGLLPAMLMCSGCGREERREAVTLAHLLQQKNLEIVATNALEKDLLTGTRDWCDNIVANGSGRGATLEQNVASAKVLAQSAAVVSAQLSTLRQTIYDQPLKQDFPQSVRGGVLRDLTDRQKRLQEVRTALEDSAASFLQFQQSRTYNGDSYPPGVAKLAKMLSNYTGPSNPLIKAIEDLKTNYELKDVDLAIPSSGPAKT